MRHFGLLFIAAFVFTILLQAQSTLLAETRTWSDESGTYKVKAEFVELVDGQVALKKETGEVVRVPLNKLSTADQRWVERAHQKAPAPNLKSKLTDVSGWPRWRGTANDGVSTEAGLLKKWPESGPPLLWSSKGLGGGYSSIAIAGEKLVTMGKKEGQTKLICVSAVDGSPVWESALGGGDNPNCTPTIDEDAGLVFGLSFDGVLVCVNLESGQEIWRKDFTADFGGRMMSSWGYSESPLVDEDLLICTPGSDTGVLAALDKRTGNVVWKTSMPEGSAGYSSPVISTGGGVKQYITLVGKGLIGVRAADGELLWHYPQIANTTANVPTPIVQGNFVFGSSGYGDGGSALLKLMPAGRNQIRFEEVYYKKNNEVQNHHGGMVLIGKHLYMGHGHNNGLPLCLDMESGRVLWGPERGAGTGSAAIVAADGSLYFRYENGVMALIEATPSGYKLNGKFDIKTKNGNSWSHPVIVDKKLYLRDQDDLHCYDIAS